MTSRLLGNTSMPKERSKTTFLPSDTFYYEPEESIAKSYVRGKQDNSYRFGDFRGECPESNGRRYDQETEEDPDVLYKRSKDRFGSWDIRDIAAGDSTRRDGKGTIVENSKNIPGSRDDDRNGSKRVSDTMEKMEKDKHMESSRNGNFLGESSKIRRNGENQRKPNFPSNSTDDVTIPSTEDPRIIIDNSHRNRHRRRHRYIFDGTFGGEDFTTRDETNRGIDRRRSKSVEKVPRNYEHYILDKDSSTFGGEEQRIPRFSTNVAVVVDERNDIDHDGDRNIEEEDPEIGHEETDPRGVKEISSRNGKRSISKDTQEGENNVRKPARPFEDFDVRIERYERGLPKLGRDSSIPKKSVSRAVDRTASKRDSSKDREIIRRISFNDLDASRKTSTKDSTTRRPSFKDQNNGIRPRNVVKNDHVGGIKCTIKSRSNDPIKGERQRPELGKVSFESQDGQTSDRVSVRVERTEDERKRIFRHESPSTLDRISYDIQKRHVLTDNDKNKDVESTKMTTAGRRRRISFKEGEKDKDIRKKSDCSFNDRFESPEFDRNESTSRERSGRYRWKKVIDDSRGDVDSRGHPAKERSASPDKKYERRSSRVLTPSRGRRVGGGDDGGEGGGGEKDPIRSTESWREDNRLFATRYLRENGRATVTKSNVDDEDDRDSEPDFPEVRSIVVSSPQERVTDRIDPETRGRIASTVERNGTTIVRILTGAGEATSSRGDLERRRRRRPVQQELCLEHRRRKFDASRYDSEEETLKEEKVGMPMKGEVRKKQEQVLQRDHREDDDDDDDEEEEEERRRDNNDVTEYRQDSWRGSRRNDGVMPGLAGSTPSRRLWNYREGGVLITDVEEGQPCLQCGEACPGFSPHVWRKNCTSCKCPREDHDVCHEEWASVRSRLGLKTDDSNSPLGFSDPRERGLAWAPPGLPPHKVDEYFAMLPDISVPRLGTPGERYRDRQLAFQLPKQDLARAYCRYLDPKHASSADDFMAARNEIALDIGTVQEVIEEGSYCGTCQEPLKYGSLAVSTSKLGLLYHPACFRCTDCKELLVDLAYCVHEDVIFCERHYAEQLKPRCSACDELIFSGEYTKAMNKDWHSGHFCCWQCDESLTGQRYVLRDEHPYCIKCYESIFANGCEECNKIIGIDSKDLSYKDKHWHEACFLCNRCRVSLVDKQFGSKVDKIYCGNCYDAQFASRCDGCGEIFRAGTKKMEYKTRQWHEKCFCCVVCKNPIGTKSFIPREQEIYCASCYEDKFATRCVKCNKIITSGGVTYKNEPWHRDCFTCSHCNNSLAGQRFTSRDDKPYCADCFGELFAKRCTACSKPITGIGGTRFISFEDRHWHNECFICAGCKTSLVGRGFITDGDDIICPECAKAKLM